MRRLISGFVDVRPGEGRAAVSVFLTLFLLIAGHTMLETARDTLFLQRLEPNRLPLVYGCVALVTLVAAPLSARFTRAIGRRNALVATLLVAAYGTALFHLIELTPGVVFALYAWTALCSTVFVMQFWLFAGELLTVAQGKRLFGPIAAGGVLGAVAGASAAAGLLMVLPVASLVLGAAGVFLGAALVLTTTRSEDERAPALLPRAAGAKAVLDSLRQQPYVSRLAAVALLSSAALLATDYLFKSTAASAFPSSELGPFFARYYAVINAAAFTMQLFGAAALVRRLGVVPSLGVLPLLLLIGSGGALLLGVPVSVVLLVKAADGTLRHSLNRVGSELVQMPLSAALLERVKTFIDGTLPRLTQAATAAGLLLLSSVDESRRAVVALVGLLSVGWVFAALALRRPYVQLFREALAKRGFDSGIRDQDLNVDSIEAVLDALSSTEPARVIDAMELLFDKNRVRLIPSLVLFHESELVLRRALEILAASTRDDWVPHAERLLGHSSETVRAAALRALALRGQYAALERGLEDPSAAVRAHAAFWLVSIEQVDDPLNDPRISHLFALDGDARKAAHVALLGAVGDSPHERWTPVVLALAETADLETFEHVAHAMGKLKDARFVPLLIPRLELRDGRAAVRDALVELGDTALEALERALRDPTLPGRVRMHVPRTISRFHSQRAADILLEELGSEQPGVVRYKVLRGLGRLVAETPVTIDRNKIDIELRKNLVEYLRVFALHTAFESAPRKDRGERSGRLVLGLLEDKMAQALERAFRLMQIRHRREDIRSVHFAVRSSDKRRRANALELLDNLMSRSGNPRAVEVRELVLLAVDELPATERVARAALYLDSPPRNLRDALRALIADADETLASFAAYHALQLDSSELQLDVANALSQRPGLNRAAGELSLFPHPPVLRHAY